MLINCTTKGCLQQTEAKLDRDTQEVICEECGNPIQNITPFTKKILNSMGQILRSNTKKPFQAYCTQCNTHRSLFIKDGKAYIQAGAGIVADSDPEREYQECMNKAMALFRAVKMAEDGDFRLALRGGNK